MVINKDVYSFPQQPARALRLTRAAGSKLEQAQRACGLSRAKRGCQRAAICVDLRRFAVLVVRTHISNNNREEHTKIAELLQNFYFF